jgi:hypothetical protein
MDDHAGIKTKFPVKLPGLLIAIAYLYPLSFHPFLPFFTLAESI